MTNNLEAFQVLLAQMRDDFLGELSERCDSLEVLILVLEKSTGDREAFNELFRGVHSLKGSGGTHGLSIITTLCHQLENLITETGNQGDFGTAFSTQAFAYVDLLRRIESLARQSKPEYSAIESALDKLRLSSLKSRKTGLIAESSMLMVGLYQKALEAMPLQLMVENNGMAALERLLHEHFDFIIVGRELDELNGIALMAALRSSHTHNQNIPVILVSSKREAVPQFVGVNAVPRDKNLADNLINAVQKVLN